MYDAEQIKKLTKICYEIAEEAVGQGAGHYAATGPLAAILLHNALNNPENPEIGDALLQE